MLIKRRTAALMTVIAAMTTSAPAAAQASATVSAARNAARADATGGDRCRLPVFGPGSAYHPLIDRRRTGPEVTNRFFPLPAGRVTVFTGVKDGRRAVDVVVVTGRTRWVDGVRTRVVVDRLYLDGRLEERTSDYYAQDACGNVWYFGEDTAELDNHGRVVSREGSFHAGVDGAQPGVFMPARPRVGQRFRQEWYRGHAEDVFTIEDVDTRVAVPAGSFRHALRTQETTELEPGVVDAKHYVRDVGEVVERAVRGPAEQLELVDLIDTAGGRA